MRSASVFVALPKRRQLLLSLVAAAFAPAVARAAGPASSAVPGGVAKVVLGAMRSAPEARAEGRRVLVMREGSEWVALVGVSLDAKPGSKLRLEVEPAASFEIQVAAKKYPEQHLNVPPGQ